jgi:hypothetical protein
MAVKGKLKSAIRNERVSDEKGEIKNRIRNEDHGVNEK